jgi:ubiquinone/menaquinone biosynthesis C-methylase UbiE
VIDLGSGAGNDAFIARAETGEDGKVIGIDFTPAMVEKAKANAAKLGYYNVEFRLGDIEQMPLSSNVANVVVSNCVLNLVPNKDGVFKEIYRVLKPGGHFSISDIVLVGDLPDSLQASAEMYAGCVSGAIQKEEYLNLMKSNGFSSITLQKEKQIIIPMTFCGIHFLRLKWRSSKRVIQVFSALPFMLKKQKPVVDLNAVIEIA